jgi:hypothetical protein
MSQNSNLFLSIGKPVKDEYGRVIGKIATFSVTPSGKFDSVFIERGDGRFGKYSTEHLQVEGADAILLSKLKSDTSVFCDQIPLLWRKDQALKGLSDKKKISPELYKELHTSFEGALTQLKTDAQSLSEEVNAEIKRCEGETKELNYALVHLEIEHEIGKIDDQNYEKAFTLIQENLKVINIEKADLEATKIKIANILLGDTSKVFGLETNKAKTEAAKEPPYTSPELPEPPVVVYVKEIGKAGI